MALPAPEILRVEPLTMARIEQIIDRMDRITADYVHLFSTHDGESAALPGMYAELRAKIGAEMVNSRDRPPSADLTRAGLSGWTEADFVRVFREGKRPDGRELDNRYMPWRNSGVMTDDELHAIWMYLQSLPGTATPAGT